MYFEKAAVAQLVSHLKSLPTPLRTATTRINFKKAVIHINENSSEN